MVNGVVTIHEFPREIAIFIGPKMYAVIKTNGVSRETAREIARGIKDDLERAISGQFDD